MLFKAGWTRDGDIYYTKEPLKLVDFIDFLEPKLHAIVAKTRADVAKSCSRFPSEGFTLPPTASGKELMPFQKAAVEFILERHSTLLAEEAGLGKTAICINTINKLNARSVFVICPATVKYNWALIEWPMWTSQPDMTVGVAEGDDFPDTDLVIINYDIIDRHLRTIHNRRWDVLICDESHKIKNSSAGRTQAVLGGRVRMKPEAAAELGATLEPGKKEVFYVPEIKADKRIFATATPMNRPKDLWSIVHACDPLGLGHDQNYFHDRYCEAYQTVYGKDINGASNLEELGALMRSRFMVRHKVSEVLPDLPPLTENVFLLPEVQVILDEEDNFLEENMDALRMLSKETGKTATTRTEWLLLLGETLIENSKLIGKPEYMPMFSMFAILRKMTALAKLPSVIDFLKDKTDDGQIPTVVFAYHRDVLDKLREAFPDHAYVMGGMKASARTDMCKMFQEGKVNWFFGNIHAAGEGVTLTRSSYLCFAEMDWQGTALIQARKRIHRITQNQPCFVDYLCANKSFDAIIYDTAVRKMKYIADTMEL